MQQFVFYAALSLRVKTTLEIVHVSKIGRLFFQQSRDVFKRLAYGIFAIRLKNPKRPQF